MSVAFVFIVVIGFLGFRLARFGSRQPEKVKVFAQLAREIFVDYRESGRRVPNYLQPETPCHPSSNALSEPPPEAMTFKSSPKRKSKTG